MNDDFVSQAELGRLLSISEHQLVKALVHIGLRTRDMMPSAKAFEDGLVKDLSATPGRHFWHWHREKTMKAIEEAFRAEPKEIYERQLYNLTHLGILFGVTSHQIGKWLKQIGLRTPEGKPSPRAFEDGFVDQRGSTQPGTYYWVWHGARTQKVLEEAGFKALVNTEAEPNN